MLQFKVFVGASVKIVLCNYCCSNRICHR